MHYAGVDGQELLIVGGPLPLRTRKSPAVKGKGRETPLTERLNHHP